MLIQFSVKNFKSIRDKITLDMKATDIKEHQNKIIKAKNGDFFYRWRRCLALMEGASLM